MNFVNLLSKSGIQIEDDGDVDLYDIWFIINKEFGFVSYETLMNQRIKHIMLLLNKINKHYKELQRENASKGWKHRL